MVGAPLPLGDSDQNVPLSRTTFLSICRAFYPPEVTGHCPMTMPHPTYSSLVGVVEVRSHLEPYSSLPSRSRHCQCYRYLGAGELEAWALTSRGETRGSTFFASAVAWGAAGTLRALPCKRWHWSRLLTSVWSTRRSSGGSGNDVYSVHFSPLAGLAASMTHTQERPAVKKVGVLKQKKL